MRGGALFVKGGGAEGRRGRAARKGGAEGRRGGWWRAMAAMVAMVAMCMARAAALLGRSMIVVLVPLVATTALTVALLFVALLVSMLSGLRMLAEGTPQEAAPTRDAG